MIAQLVGTSCLLTGFFIGSFNVLMLAADHYGTKTSGSKQAIKIVFLAKFKQPVLVLPEYSVLNSESNFRIDKTGSLRYRVQILMPAVKPEPVVPSTIVAKGYSKESVKN